MKKISYILLAAFIVASCSEDEAVPTIIKFAKTELTTPESAKSITLGIQLDQPAKQDLEVSLATIGGTATSSEDYTLPATTLVLKGETNGSFVVTILDDVKVEDDETIEIGISSAGGLATEGTYKVTIESDGCEHYDISYWKGTIVALEDYGTSTWGPYNLVLTQDATNPNKFTMTNFYDSNLPAFILFNPANGTVNFPDGQSPGGKALTNSTGTFDYCTGKLVINLTYDGGPWVYRFTKP
jgi:Calx-beta domain